MVPRTFLLVGLPALLGACNMVISEKPMFGDTDRGKIAPRDGIWLSDNPECRFDSRKRAAEWPECALWVVVRNSGTDFVLSDGKGQSQRVARLFSAGTPAILEAQWSDDAKEGAKPTYGYFGVAPQAPDQQGRFSVADAWPVACGIQDGGGSKVEPFPGITPECRPTSKEAIRAAATASRAREEVKSWRWLRAEER